MLCNPLLPISIITFDKLYKYIGSALFKTMFQSVHEAVMVKDTEKEMYLQATNIE